MSVRTKTFRGDSSESTRPRQGWSDTSPTTIDGQGAPIDEDAEDHPDKDRHNEAADDTIQPPEPAHVHDAAQSPHTQDTDSDSELEATELRTLQSHHAAAALPRLSHILSPGQPLIHWWDPMKRFWRHHIRISVPHADCRDHLGESRIAVTDALTPPPSLASRWRWCAAHALLARASSQALHTLRRALKRSADERGLANERTFLGYLRNSIALSIMSILIAQLYRLEHSPHPSPVYGYFVLSKPLAVIFQSAALCLSLLGATRFLRQQSAMAVGKVHAGGWELFATGLIFFSLLFMMLSVVIAVDVYQHFHPEPD